MRRWRRARRADEGASQALIAAERSVELTDSLSYANLLADTRGVVTATPGRARPGRRFDRPRSASRALPKRKRLSQAPRRCSAAPHYCCSIRALNSVKSPSRR